MEVVLSRAVEAVDRITCPRNIGDARPIGSARRLIEERVARRVSDSVPVNRRRIGARRYGNRRGGNELHLDDHGNDGARVGIDVIRSVAVRDDLEVVLSRAVEAVDRITCPRNIGDARPIGSARRLIEERVARRVSDSVPVNRRRIGARRYGNRRGGNELHLDDHGNDGARVGIDVIRSVAVRDNLEVVLSRAFETGDRITCP